MSTQTGRLVVVALLFLVIFVSGFWLKHIGKPYNLLLVTFHKLISLAVLVFLIVMVLKVARLSKPGALELVFLVAAGLLFVISIISGGMVSADKFMPVVFLSIHRVTPYLTIIVTAASLLLFFRRR